MSRGIKPYEQGAHYPSWKHALTDVLMRYESCLTESEQALPRMTCLPRTVHLWNMCNCHLQQWLQLSTICALALAWLKQKFVNMWRGAKSARAYIYLLSMHLLATLAPLHCLSATGAGLA